MKRQFGKFVLILAALLAVFGFASDRASSVAAAGLPNVTLNPGTAAPREVEDTTLKAVQRDYTSAWQAMSAALDENRSDLLGDNFVGNAADVLHQTIAQQREAGLRQHIIDNGHNVRIIFYSSDGSAMELQDTAQLKIELQDGSKVVHSEDASIHYVVLMTAAENSWKIRHLQAVPAF